MQEEKTRSLSHALHMPAQTASGYKATGRTVRPVPAYLFPIRSIDSRHYAEARFTCNLALILYGDLYGDDIFSIYTAMTSFQGQYPV